MTDYLQHEIERPNYSPYQAWRKLKYAYTDYALAKTESNFTKMKEYATKIRRLEHELSMKQTEFPELT